MKKDKMDKKNKRKTRKGNKYLSVLLFMLIGAACGVLMAIYLEAISKGDMPLGKYIVVFGLMLIAMYAAAFLQIIIHETGHLVFGLLSGYRFLSFRIGNQMWVKENGKIRLRKMSLVGTGGQCLMAPPDMEDGKIPFFLYNLGGSFMNIISSLIFTGVYFFCREARYLSFFLLLMSVVGIGIGFINGIPMRLGPVDNDGYNAKSLAKSPAALRSFWVQMKINEQTVKGVQLKDMPKEWFGIPEEDEMQNSMTAAMAVFYENRLMDQHKFEEAGELIDKLCSMNTAIVGLYNNLLACDRLYCELIGNEDEQVINNLRTKEQLKFMKQMKKFPSVLRTEYAFSLLYEKDMTKVNQIKEQFEKCAATYPYASDIESERELLQIADEAAKVLGI